MVQPICFVVCAMSFLVTVAMLTSAIIGRHGFKFCMFHLACIFITATVTIFTLCMWLKELKTF